MSTRGRPRQFDRDQALETAMRLFRHHGYEGTSVSFLGESMGINTPSLYAAFGSKDALYQEAVNLYLTKVVLPLFTSMSNATSAREGIKTLLEKCAEAFTCNPESGRGCMVLNGDLVYAPSQQKRAKDMTQRRSFAGNAILQRLERAQLEHEIPADTNVKALASYFLMLLQGLSIGAHDDASQQDLQQIINMAMLAWPGLASRIKGDN